jgi:hypothetical protein
MQMSFERIPAETGIPDQNKECECGRLIPDDTQTVSSSDKLLDWLRS